MKNTPLPKVQYDDNLEVIMPTHLVKGAFVLGLDVALISFKNATEDIAKCKMT